MTTKITPSVLADTTVVAATHGNGATIPVIVVDPQGRITGVTNTTVGIATSQITSGTLADARLPDQSSLSAAAYFGDAAKVPTFVTDAKGRIKSAANVTIAIASSAVSGLASSATTDTTNAGNISSGTLPNARLSDTGVVASTHGTASSVSQVIVDSKGRITGASNVAIQIATSQITSYPTFASSATTDTTNAGNISSGTLPDARLSNAGTNTGLFGTASVVPRINVDAKGRVTAVVATNIAIAAGAVSGLATVATSGSYNDLSGRPTIPTIPASLPASDVYAWAKAATKPTYAYSEITSLPTIPTTVGQLTAVAPDVQQFDTTSTWTKPTGGQTMARIMVWGGGANGNGTGGSYNEQIVPLSWLASSVTAVVGAGQGAGNFGAVAGASSFALATGLNGKMTVAAGGGVSNGASQPGVGDYGRPYLYQGGGAFYTDYSYTNGVYVYPTYGGGSNLNTSIAGASATSTWGGNAGGVYPNSSVGNVPGGAGGKAPDGSALAGAGGRIVVMSW
jgi:hypothetical protein